EIVAGALSERHGTQSASQRADRVQTVEDRADRPVVSIALECRVGFLYGRCDCAEAVENFSREGVARQLCKPIDARVDALEKRCLLSLQLPGDRRFYELIVGFGWPRECQELRGALAL